MTSEELKNKKVTITLNMTMCLGEDLGDDILASLTEDQKDLMYTDEDLLEKIIPAYYGTLDDLLDVLEYKDFNVTIHD